MHKYIQGFICCCIRIVLKLFAGHISAIYKLGEMHAEGIGVKRNCNYAVDVSVFLVWNCVVIIFSSIFLLTHLLKYSSSSTHFATCRQRRDLHRCLLTNIDNYLSIRFLWILMGNVHKFKTSDVAFCMYHWKEIVLSGLHSVHWLILGEISALSSPRNLLSTVWWSCSCSKPYQNEVIGLECLWKQRVCMRLEIWTVL